MKRLLLSALSLLFLSTMAIGQIVYEDFEGGSADLNWVGADGTYNGLVVNPDQSGVNASAACGSYTKSGAHAYSLFIADLGAPMNLTTNNQFKIQVYSTAATQILLKLEGTGPAIEGIKPITQVNQWVEYTFDFSAAAGYTGLSKIIIFFDPGVETSADTYLFDNLRATGPGIVYEDFEGGVADLNWVGADGTYNGVVENEDSNSVNGSEFAGSYTKSGAHAYSLFITDLGAPMDLTVNNQFKIQIFATAATQLLMKLEGTGGAIEAIKNIAVTGAWQEYTFDFSAAANNTGLSKIILFFDPGEETSTDTYLFDNLVAVSEGACANATPDADIIDDFECNRNATYGAAWEFLTVVNNPNVSVVNPSAKVGRLEDPPGPWYALVIDYQNPIDLSTKNFISIKVWAPRTGNLLFKLEGGISPAAEIFVPVTEVNQWVEYIVDFSAQAAANHKRIAIFVNAGNGDFDGDIYYLDDIKRIAAPIPGPLEDFEDGQFAGADLLWLPLNGDNVLHGIYGGVVANPAPNGVNDSPNIGRYTKGSSPFSTLSGFLPDVIDLSSNSQINLDVWAPAGSTSVRMQLVSATQGNKEVTRDLTATGEWVELNFDFSAFSAITDFQQVNLLFDPGVAGAGTIYYYDNLQQGISTVDPCEGVEPIANIVDDFECQRNVLYSTGENNLEVVNNPSLESTNPSLKSGEYTDPQDEWSALVLDFGQTIDLSLYNQFTISIRSAAVVPLLFKLEGGTSPAVEVFTEVSATNAWVKYSIDFSAFSGQDHKKVAIFFNAGQLAGANDVYHIDNISWARAPYTTCVMDFESPEFSVTNWRYFANGSLEGTPFEIVDNPAPGGTNNSDNVGIFVEAADGAEFAGMYADLEAPIVFPDLANKTISMKVLSNNTGIMTMKLEGSATGAPSTPDNNVDYTTPGVWQTLSWNFAAVPDDAQYRRVTLILNFGVIPGVTTFHYFDDIAIGAAVCTPVGTDELAIERLSIAPNPTTGEVLVRNAGDLRHFVVYDLLGKVVLRQQTTGQDDVRLDLYNFSAGMYTIAAFNQEGLLVANTKLIKH